MEQAYPDIFFPNPSQDAILFPGIKSYNMSRFNKFPHILRCVISLYRESTNITLVSYFPHFRTGVNMSHSTWLVRFFLSGSFISQICFPISFPVSCFHNCVSSLGLKSTCFTTFFINLPHTKM